MKGTWSRISGEKISNIKSIIDENLLGVMLSCVSPENYEHNLEEIKIIRFDSNDVQRHPLVSKIIDAYKKNQ